MIPRATYRLQFHQKFPFSAAVPLLPYLQRLGISHVYSSPIFSARPGSMHGYDVVDYGVISPELGGENDFRRWVVALEAHGLGLILDIVPNHMAMHEGNRWWMDVLEHGADSPFANYFDIDWAALDGKILLAILGRPYWETLQAGELRIERDAGSGALSIRYFERRLPLRPEDQAIDPSQFRASERLHGLLERQHYRLAWWRTANDTINWRRFFDVPDLIAVKQDTDSVFEESHAKTFELYREGLIDGVRVDHIDGLADPAGYCHRLRQRLNELGARRNPPDEHPYIVIEKILARGEELPNDWDVDGTTGYDFMDEVSALQHDAAGARPLARLWSSISGRSEHFKDEETQARGEIATISFESALSRAVDSFFVLGQSAMATRDIARPAIRRGLVRILQHLRVYRTYATGQPNSLPAGASFDNAVSAAKASAGVLNRAAIEFIADVIRGTCALSDGRRDAVCRFNQLSAPVAAKGVEDTAFYRYARLLSRNDVGFDPGAFSRSSADFHADMSRRAARFPNALLATATHDHKRGEDVRARLAVLSEIPEEWTRAVESWFSLNAPYRPAGLDRGDEYQLYQTLVGAWPLALPPDSAQALGRFYQRVRGWQEKALREAKLRSSWLDPDEEYEAHADAFLRAVLDPQRSSEFLLNLRAFVDRIAPGGALNGLVQTALRCCAPGVPDCYQGSELWDFSLVDPDNRRPVDYTDRRAGLEQAPPNAFLSTWEDGRVKEYEIGVLLNLRRTAPEVFRSGAYEALSVEGEASPNVVAFVRRWREQAMLVAVPIHCGQVCTTLPLAPVGHWNGTFIAGKSALRAQTWKNVFDNDWDGKLRCNSLFARFPVAVLTNF